MLDFKNWNIFEEIFDELNIKTLLAFGLNIKNMRTFFSPFIIFAVNLEYFSE